MRWYDRIVTLTPLNISLVSGKDIGPRNAPKEALFATY